MSYARPRFNIEIDWIAGVLISLFAVFQAAVLGLILLAQQTVTTTPQRDSLSISAEILVIAAVEITLIIGLFRLYRRLSGKWQTYVKYGLLVAILIPLVAVVVSMYWGYPILLLRNSLIAITIVGVAYLANKHLSQNGLRWIGFNVIALLLGVIVVAIASQQIAPVVVLPIMVAFTIYDYVAVDLSNIMGDLVSFSGSLKLPNLIVVPNTLRIDLDALFAYMQGERDEKPDGVAFVIGLGDFIFPTLLVASVYVQESISFTPPVVGAMLGTLIAIPVLRAAVIRRDKATPALPWLNTGAIGGYAIGLVVALAA